MIKKIRIPVIMILLAMPLTHLDAQVVSKAVCEKYPPGVIVRLYELVKDHPVTEEMQIKMADRIQAVDLLTAENIKAGKTPDQVDSLRRAQDAVLFAITEKINATLYDQHYLEGYIGELLKVKPSVPDGVLRNIRKAFYAQMAKNNYADKAQVLMDIMQHIYPDTAITAHFYGAGIEKQVAFLSAAERHQLLYSQHVTRDAYDSIYPLVKQKNYQQVLIEYTYGGNSRLRDSLLTVATRYYDSSIYASLLRDGSLLSSSQFSIALKYKKLLKLSPSLTEPLLAHAMYLHQLRDSITLKDPFAKTDFKVYEAKYMKELLSEDEYTQLLTIKNSSQAKTDAESDWNEMERRGIAIEFDHDVTVRQLLNYYLAKWNAYYRFADDPVQQDANLQVLKQEQPRALTVLGAAKKMPKPVNSNTSLQIKW